MIEFRDESLQSRLKSGEEIGSLLRGERMTLGLELEDVHNRLRIRTEFIEAFENNDLDSIGRPQFVAGYIRSYANLLKMDPELVLSAYEEQCGLVRMKSTSAVTKTKSSSGLQFANPRLTWSDRFGKFSHTTSLALPLIFVFVFIGAAVYGVTKFISGSQQLKIVPTESRPLAQTQNEMPKLDEENINSTSQYPTINYDELYKRQALQTPVVTPRSGRIADVDPNTVGAFGQSPVIDTTAADLSQTQTVASNNSVFSQSTSNSPVVTVGPSIPEIELLPAGEAWVRLTNAEGDVLLEKLLQPGEVLGVPVDGQIPILRRAGNASELFVRVNGQVFGPIGLEGKSVVNNIPLTPDAIATSYETIDEELLLNLNEKETSYLAKAQGEQ